ncbi:11711_t:CDS:2 [Diversispora eburnea]|uniref:11711_t:CDS:1 n=1 Tax=Diversispora eburnea TaxID=1213867 RepID=A0A9N8YLF7_9GLOM|nr:11711_t:CDS:2 [Diversispora eburnea]
MLIFFLSFNFINLIATITTQDSSHKPKEPESLLKAAAVR